MIFKSFFVYFLTTFILFAAESNIGDTIAAFSANDENGQLWNLQDNLKQKYLVVYFYPVALSGG